MITQILVILHLVCFWHFHRFVQGNIPSEEIIRTSDINKSNDNNQEEIQARNLQEAELIEIDLSQDIEKESNKIPQRNRRKRRKKQKKGSNQIEGEAEEEIHQPLPDTHQSEGVTIKAANTVIKTDIHPASDSAMTLAKKAFVCRNDTMLNYVASNNPTKSIMYIISHNNDSDSIANLYRDCYGRHWIETARLSKSIYFESSIYHDFFPQHQTTWEKYDFVITATYKTLTRQLLPRRIPVQTMQQIKQMLFLVRDHQHELQQNNQNQQQALLIENNPINNLNLDALNYDVYPFFRDYEDVIPTSIKYHGPNFLKVWHLLLQQLGYSMQTIQRLYYIKGFYRNAFIIKPSILKKLIHFMKQAMYIAENHAEIKQLLSSNAYYVWGKKDIALDIFNTTYYQLYPFVFERLPIFYLYVNNYKICIGPDTPCKYNYKG